MEQNTAVIADDPPMIRKAVAQLLTTAGLVVVAEAQDGLEAIAQVRAHRPTLLVLDIAMPHARGIEVFAEAKRWSPETKTLVFSGMTSVSLFQELVDEGANGVFFKRGEMSVFADAVPRILAGENIVAPDIQSMLKGAENTARLTLRERQVLSLICHGNTNKQIAEQLGVSAKTIDNHRTNLMSKVGAHSIAELLAYAVREGVLETLKES
jgi:DNA-binding NarL/FixJ family response regulator